MNNFLSILLFIGFSIIVLVVFNLLKHFILSKLKVNKWIVLGAAIVFFFLPAFLTQFQGYIIRLVMSSIFVILFLWFIDLAGYGIKKKEKKIKIKPKAKPNRVKYIKEIEDKNKKLR
ncbi:hypothetical protein CPJCM30710_29980 [Clostridium polyendosporum]|uniref:Uncharacterized protein n=1 Tax=Clostridium polyendosporum TaxID=69208 RepID=A0A919VHJ9_9CLOT|nr:hypothetical protein [Clostridium polyendosporum]GIM30332.1 hypothetical protein CPJCM30710_29980 [Clostridium polyendosporum]